MTGCISRLKVRIFIKMQNIPKIPFNQIVKSPAAYYMVVAVSVMWFFVYKFTDSSKETIVNLKAELSHQREENKILRREGKVKDQKLDSMGALMLKRTDNSYEELIKMIDINNKKSTIIIKPKRK